MYRIFLAILNPICAITGIGTAVFAGIAGYTTHLAAQSYAQNGTYGGQTVGIITMTVFAVLCGIAFLCAAYDEYREMLKIVPIS